eukprot:9492051-Pyramimonas_sp.AAC.1
MPSTGSERPAACWIKVTESRYTASGRGRLRPSRSAATAAGWERYAPVSRTDSGPSRLSSRRRSPTSWLTSHSSDSTTDLTGTGHDVRADPPFFLNRSVDVKESPAIGKDLV